MHPKIQIKEKLMDKVTLYKTPTCPRCKVLMIKLDKAGIQYDVVDDMSTMAERGIKQAPILEVNGELLDLTAANNWINGQNKE